MADKKKQYGESSSSPVSSKSSKLSEKSKSTSAKKSGSRPTTPNRTSLGRPSITYLVECDPSESEIQKMTIVDEEQDKEGKDGKKGFKSWNKNKPRSFSSLSQKLSKKSRSEAFTSTSELFEPTERQIFLKKTLRNMILYIIFILLVTIMAVGMVFPSMYYLTRALTELFITKPFTIDQDFEITFKEITNADEFWMYSRTVLTNGFYWDYWYINETSDDENKIILYENKLIGVPRFRQLKVKGDTCMIPDRFKKMEESCYAHFSEDAEDVDAFGPQSDRWEHNNEEDLSSISYKGKIGTYHGGGFIQIFGTNRKDTEKIIEKLQKNSWISRGTRCIFLDFVVYNPNLNLFCIAKLVFEFSPTGSIIPSYSLRTVKLIRYVTQWDYIVKTCEWLCVLFLIYYTVEEIIEMYQLGTKYFYQFWNYVDLAVVITGLLCISYFFVNESESLDAVANNIHLVNEFANFEAVAELEVQSNIYTGIFMFLAYIKIFKYLGFNKNMGQLNSTLQRCGADIAAFTILAFIMFFAYAQLGYLLFGTQIESYHSVGYAMFTLFRTILGDFDYVEIENVDADLAAFFFLTYIFFVFFVLLNMFLAIINDTYADVKSNLAAAPDELQMSDYLRDVFYRFFKKFRCGGCIKRQSKKQEDYDITLKEIRNALKKCGFTDIEIQMFFEKFNVDPTAEVGDFDIELVMKALEEMTRHAKESDFKSSGLVTPQDYIAQEVRIGEMDDTLYVINAKVDSLLRRLDSIDIVKKAAYPIPKFR